MSTARRLDKLVEWPKHEAFADGWHTRFKSAKYHNCYLGFGGLWQVKMFLGGEQRVLGETFDRLRAIRFADMALVHFARYRVRRNRPMTDDDVNFSVITAKFDLANCPEATKLLVEWETHLLRAGLIAEVSAVQQRDNRTANQVRRDMNNHFRQLCADYTRVRALVDAFPGARIACDMAHENAAVLRKLNDSLNTALFTSDAAPA